MDKVKNMATTIQSVMEEIVSNTNKIKSIKNKEVEEMMEVIMKCLLVLNETVQFLLITSVIKEGQIIETREKIND